MTIKYLCPVCLRLHDSVNYIVNRRVEVFEKNGEMENEEILGTTTETIFFPCGHEVENVDIEDVTVEVIGDTIIISGNFPAEIEKIKEKLGLNVKLID